MMRSSAWLALLACSVRQAQVAGLGEGDRVLHRLAVADLADQDHVGRLAQRVLQRRFPGLGVDADLALRDDAVLVLVHVLDRVLDGDDVAVASSRCGSRSSPRARSTCPSRCAPTKITRPRLVIATSFSTGGRPQLVELRDRGGDGPQHHADAALLDEGVDAEAADARRADGEVALLGRLELGRLLVVHDRARELRGVLRASARCCDTGVILPSTLIAGGKPAVMKRSDAFLRDHQRAAGRSMNLVA